MIAKLSMTYFLIGLNVDFFNIRDSILSFSIIHFFN